MVNAPEVEQQEMKAAENGNESHGNAETKDANAAAATSIAEVNWETATNLLNKGKRNLICDNIAQAVAELSQSCAQFDQVFGEGNIKCAKSYFWYGSALLEMARLENGVLGNALQGNPTEECASANDETAGKKLRETEATKPSEEKEDTKSEEKNCEKEEDIAEKQKDVESEKDASSKETTDEQTDAAVENGENSAEQEDEADKENEDEGDNAEGEEELDAKGVAQLEESIGGEEDEEDDDNDDEDDSLKLSWQMLDWARKLLETATDNEVEGRDDLLAQCFLKLGENLMEAAHHPEADVEFKKCIDIYQACYAQVQANANKPETEIKNANLIERSMAEAYFVAGLNLVNGKNYTNASNHFESAIGVIKKRLVSLQTKVEKLGENEKEKKDECTQEMEELSDILPNIIEKLAEAKLCSAQEVVKEGSEGACSGGSALQQAFKEVEELESKTSESNESKSAIDSAPVNDISHLVKRKSPLKQKANGVEHKEDGTTKRKADSESDESMKKKQKVEETSVESASNCAA